MIPDLYNDKIYHEGFSVFSGGEKTSGYLERNAPIFSNPIMKAFLEDDDIQEVTITSANIGFSRTYRKEFKR